MTAPPKKPGEGAPWEGGDRRETSPSAIRPNRPTDPWVGRDSPASRTGAPPPIDSIGDVRRPGALDRKASTQDAPDRTGSVRATAGLSGPLHQTSSVARTMSRTTAPGAYVPGRGAHRTTTPGTRVEPEAWARDRQRRTEITKYARELMIRLDALSRLLQTHEASNSAVRTVLDEIDRDLQAMHGLEGDLAIVFAQGHAFVNGVWIRASRRSWDSATVLTEGLSDLDGRGIVIKQGEGPDGVLGLARLLRQSRRQMSDEARRDQVRQLPGLQLIPLSGSDEGRGGSAEARHRAADVFTEGLRTLNQMQLAELDLFLRRRQRAFVRNLVELAESDPEELLAITAIRDPTLPPAAHTLMVCIYAIAMGRSIDLGRRELLRIGLAALNHNLGEMRLPPELFAAAQQYEPWERKKIEQHPLLGLEHLLVHYGYAAPTVERAIVAAEHHVHWDGGGGYPFASYSPRHLFSRIVAVCDVFDALCSDRPQRLGYAPDQAVKLLLREAGARLDPVLVRAMVRLVGPYPPGALVELDSGEWAIVLGPGKGADPLGRPRVLLISDADGFEYGTPMAVDLGERYPRRQAWLRTIVRARDARKAGLRLPRYLLADRVDVEPTKLDHDTAVRPAEPPARPHEIE